MGRRGTPEVYTIAPGLPFVDALAAGMLARAGHDPAKLARAIVLLPTRRACQALRDAFLRQRDGEPTLLPRLVPLGEVDEEELALAGAGIVGGDSDGAEAALAPAISPLRRQILLARTVLTAGAGFAPGGRATTPDQAARLAAELGRFLDQVQTERLSFAGLEDLVPDEYARHWQITLRFLTILTEHWPRILADEGTLDAADRRNRLLEAQARAWATRAPDVPVIAAGSTGSIPATADLLEVVAGLPRGCLVLPGLDRSLEADEASALGESHPQFGLARLLDRLGVAPAQVPDWECAAVRAAGIAAGSAARARLIAEAMRPAETTHLWRVLDLDVADAMDGVSRIDCPGAHEEAGVIALVMRQALELPGRTVALVKIGRASCRERV